MFLENLGQFFWYLFPKVLIYFKTINQSMLGMCIIHLFTSNFTYKGFYNTVCFPISLEEGLFSSGNFWYSSSSSFCIFESRVYFLANILITLQ